MNKDKFKAIYNDNYQKVIRLCLGYCNGNIPLAKDLTQEVFVKVWENLGNFRETSSLSTWIYRIAVNTCLMHIRKNKKQKLSVELPYNLKGEPENNSNSQEQKLSQLYACINKLTKSNKAIILLELEGLPQIEIANIMGLKHEALRVRIHRIKGQLTKCVKG